MKILIIDECFYTRSGVNTYLNSVSSIKLMDVPTVEEATLAIQEFQPDIIIVNFTLISVQNIIQIATGSILYSENP